MTASQIFKQDLDKFGGTLKNQSDRYREEDKFEKAKKCWGKASIKTEPNCKMSPNFERTKTSSKFEILNPQKASFDSRHSKSKNIDVSERHGKQSKSCRENGDTLVTSSSGGNEVDSEKFRPQQKQEEEEEEECEPKLKKPKYSQETQLVEHINGDTVSFALVLCISIHMKVDNKRKK